MEPQHFDRPVSPPSVPDPVVSDPVVSDPVVSELVADEQDEHEVLEGLERDLVAVEEGMARLDAAGVDAAGIHAIGTAGSDAATRVAAIVDSQRFAVDPS